MGRLVFGVSLCGTSMRTRRTYADQVPQGRDVRTARESVSSAQLLNST